MKTINKYIKLDLDQIIKYKLKIIFKLPFSMHKYILMNNKISLQFLIIINHNVLARIIENSIICVLGN